MDWEWLPYKAVKNGQIKSLNKIAKFTVINLYMGSIGRGIQAIFNLGPSKLIFNHFSFRSDTGRDERAWLLEGQERRQLVFHYGVDAGS